jgi:GMP synthase (glutamine-hydrolysing)
MLGGGGAQATTVESPAAAPPGTRCQPRVVVWEADGAPCSGRGYGHPITARLAAAGIASTTVPLTRRAPTPEEQAATVHVLSGGMTPATSNQLWVRLARRALEPVLLRALAGEATVTGVCFGAQMIAATLAGPGAVGPNPWGLEAGLVLVHTTGSLPGMPGRRRWPSSPVPSGGSGAGRTAATVVSQIHYHHIDGAAVRALGGEVVLSNDHTAVQAFTIGPTITGLQFHPELDPPATRATIEAHRDLLRTHGVTPADVVASIDRLGGSWSPGAFDRFVTHPARTALTALAA